MADAPAGAYRALRFHVGPDAVQNAADGGRLAPDDPLNPLVNGLHWSWQGGFVFLALEGLFRAASGASSFAIIRADGPSYAELARFAADQRDLFDPAEESIACFCGD